MAEHGLGDIESRVRARAMLGQNSRTPLEEEDAFRKFAEAASLFWEGMEVQQQSMPWIWRFYATLAGNRDFMENFILLVVQMESTKRSQTVPETVEISL